jgi:hypothetical protein
MRMTKRTAMVLAVILALGAGVNPALAAGVPITNASFENPALGGTGNFVLGIPGWELVLGAQVEYGVWWPGEFDYDVGVPDGQNIAFVDSQAPVGSGIVAIQQTLEASLEPNTRYTLAVSVGNNSGVFAPEFMGFPGYRVELWAGDRLLAVDHNTQTPAEGNFVTSKIAYTASPCDPSFGQPFTIRLVNLLAGPGREVDFDNVTLVAESADVVIYDFFFADAEGSVSGRFSYDQSVGSEIAQGIPGDATLVITEASGDLAAWTTFDFTGGVVRVRDQKFLDVGLTGLGFFVSFGFARDVSLSELLPLGSFRVDSSRVLMSSLVVVDGNELGSLVTLRADSDGDLVLDADDNCLCRPNPSQHDTDADGRGDACECGDASNDGRVNTTDARLIQRCATGQIPCSGLCDTTGEGTCDTTDARLIQRLAVGQISKNSLFCAELFSP